MGAKRYSLRERTGYWFDNKMSQGFWPKVRLLLLVTFAFVIILGLLASLVRNPGESPQDAFFRIFMYALGKGGAPELGRYSGVIAVALAVVTILYCMFFTAILIGLINQALRGKVEELGKGRNRVLEEGHILILGFNDATLVVLEELIEADRNQKKPQTVVVLDVLERSKMVDIVRSRFRSPRHHPKTRIICRTGSCYRFEDLKRCALEMCRCVIVCAPTDFDAIKAIMACSHVLDQNDAENEPYIVSVIHGDENIVESRAAARGKRASDRLVTLSLNETLARIMVHTSRKPGLSDVFTELFNYADDEFYIVDSDAGFPALYGKTIAEINHYLQMSYAVGIENPKEGVVIGPPRQVVFNEGDSLIVVKEDDDPLLISQKPGRHVQLSPTPVLDSGKVNVLILGLQPIIMPILREYANYLAAGSVVHVVDEREARETPMAIVDDETSALLKAAGLELVFHSLDCSSSQGLLALLRECKPDSVVILVDQDCEDPDKEDERVMRELLYLRDYRRRNDVHFSITSEMCKAENKELAEATEPDDFIIGRQFSALLMAQISQKREMASLFEQLLSSDGFEVYMKPASWYAPLGEPVDLISVGDVAADRGEVFIGVRQKVGGTYRVADINPSKYVSDMSTLRHYEFTEADYMVVLAEGDGYSEMAR